MKRLRILALVFVVSTALRGSALCGRPQPRLLCAEYTQSDAVVVAQLMGKKNVPRGYPDHFLYQLRLLKTLHGSVGKVFEIYEGNDSGRADFEFSVGGKYLLFLHRYCFKHDYAVEACGHSGPIEQAGSWLEAIQKLKANVGDGFISGRVVADSSDAGVADVSLFAQGAGKAQTRTDRDGNFELRVLPGVYSVDAKANGVVVEADVLSYENPRRLVIAAGGCAQIQLTTRGDKR